MSLGVRRGVNVPVLVPVGMHGLPMAVLVVVDEVGALQELLVVQDRLRRSAGEYLPVLVRGKVKLTAAGAISVGAAVKAAGSGKVQAAASTVTVPTGSTTVVSTSAQPSMTVESGIAFGVALQSASADGDTILAIVDFLG